MTLRPAAKRSPGVASTSSTERAKTASGADLVDPADLADLAIAAACQCRDAVDRLTFAEPVTHVYNPLRYAWAPHREYLRRFGATSKRVLMMGMNPGPWGMAQTGVPFGEVAAVRDWLGISGNEATVEQPPVVHPKRPVTGFACPRAEVSGRRLWGLFAARFGTPAAFFADHLVVNYCPLVFMEESGRNRTPDKLPRAEAEPLRAVCDEHIQRLVNIYRPEWLIGIGGYAARRLEAIFADGPFAIGQVLHPSPASPAANRGWAEAATRQFLDLGVWR